MLLQWRALLPACMLLAAADFIRHVDCCTGKNTDYLGCYHKNQLVQEGSREVKSIPVTYLNLQACDNECQIALPDVAGEPPASPMKALGEGKCWCGYTQVKGEKSDANLCDLKCESEHQEPCGSEKNFLSVFKTT